MAMAIEIMEVAFAVQRLPGWCVDPALLRAEAQAITEKLVQLAKQVGALEAGARTTVAEEVTA